MADNARRRTLDKARGSKTTTIIGEGMRFSGTFGGDGALIVSGEVECDCDLNGPVTVAKGGRWKGSIRADHVVIAGEVIGDARTDGKIEVAGTAHVQGSLIGGMIAVAEGAVIDGEMQTTGADSVMRFDEKRTP